MEKEYFLRIARVLVDGYKPNERVRRELEGVELVALVGPTGAGKTTLMKELGIQQVLSDVTRPPRQGEKDKRDYFFRDDLPSILNDIKQGEYVQFLIAETDEFYGTRRKSYPNDGQASMAIRADQIDHFATLGFGKIYRLYIMPPGYKEWMRRIGGRGDSDTFLRRLDEAKKSLHAALQDDYILILNDLLENAVSDIKLAISGGEVPAERQEMARKIGGDLLEKLGDADDLF